MGAEGVDKKLATEHVGAAIHPKQREREKLEHNRVNRNPIKTTNQHKIQMLPPD